VRHVAIHGVAPWDEAIALHIYRLGKRFSTTDIDLTETTWGVLVILELGVFGAKDIDIL
jgi:hypothetical protein